MSITSEQLARAIFKAQDPALFTLPMGLKAFQSDLEVAWGLYSAGAIVVSIPVVILFVSLSRYLVSGLTLGSVKE
jgi:arabinogalactan oligomer/maltooligosaccharide transport system permease protein